MTGNNYKRGETIAFYPYCGEQGSDSKFSLADIPIMKEIFAGRDIEDIKFELIPAVKMYES